MIISIPYEWGDTFYIKTDIDQYERQLVAIKASPFGLIFSLAFGERVSDHYEFELTKEKDTVKITR